MMTTTWPPEDEAYLEQIWDPKYSTEPSWFDSVQFEYHLALVVAAIIIIMAIARLLWTRKKTP